MTLKSSNSDLRNQDLIEKANLVGFSEVPESTTELETQIAQIFRETGKKFTAQAIHKLLPETKPAKYFSDKLWYMALKGTLQHTGTRGWYQWGGNPSS